MAADTANQKVFVPLKGVLQLQDDIRSLEARLTNMTDAVETASQRTRLLFQHKGYVNAVRLLGLPIEYREYR